MHREQVIPSSASVTPQDFPEIRWQGHWIWAPAEQVPFSMGLPGTDRASEQEAHALFRKTILLDAEPSAL